MYQAHKCRTIYDAFWQDRIEQIVVSSLRDVTFAILIAGASVLQDVDKTQSREQHSW